MSVEEKKYAAGAAWGLDSAQRFAEGREGGWWGGRGIKHGKES